MSSQTYNQAGETETRPDLLTLHLQPHLLLSQIHDPPLGYLLGGKAEQMEAVRPPGCLLSMDIRRNLKGNMPIATEMPGNM